VVWSYFANAGSEVIEAEALAYRRVPSINNLDFITTVDLSSCNLVTFPQFLFKLPKLVHANMSGNRIDALPMSIVKMVSLRNLDLSGNPLRMFPTRFMALLAKALPKFDHLKMSQCVISLLFICRRCLGTHPPRFSR